MIRLEFDLFINTIFLMLTARKRTRVVVSTENEGPDPKKFETDENGSDTASSTSSRPRRAARK